MRIDQKVLGNRLDRLRRDRGWTKRELAKRAGLWETHVGEIINAKRRGGRAEFITIYKLAKALGVTMEELADMAPLQNRTIEDVAREIQQLDTETVIRELQRRMKLSDKKVQIIRLLKDLDDDKVGGLIMLLGN